MNVQRLKRAPGLELAVRNAACTECRLHADTEPEDICITGQGPSSARIAIVTKFPVTERGRTYRELVDYLDQAGIDHTKVMWLSALKCRTYSLDPTKTDQKVCSTYLRAEFAHQNFDYVLCLGAEAWFAASGWADITKNRGKLFDVLEGDGVIFPTISPSAVSRNPGMRGGFLADLQYFGRLVRGEGEVPDHHDNTGHVTVVRDVEALRAMLRRVRHAWAVAYDIETPIAAESDSGACVISISLTITNGPDMGTAHTYNVPLFHPGSWFRSSWLRVLVAIVKAMLRCPRRVAHNAKFDTKWLQHFSKIEEFTPTFDTICAAALLDENRPKGLKPLAQMLLGAEPWGIDTTDLMNEPIDNVLEYNGLDTWHTLRLFFVLRQQLLEQPRLARFFKHLMMPLVRELCYVERRGVFVDREQHQINWNIVKSKLEDIHDQLEQYLPPTNPYIKILRDGTVKHNGVNWNASNFARWFLYEYLELPVLKRGKTKEDGSPGDPSMDESTMAYLAEMEDIKPGSDVAKLLLERVVWNKYDTAFFTPWSTLIDQNSRMHSVFKPWGTVTGRLSSGKEDSEKLTGSGSKKLKGVNLQQVPRGDLTRGIFGAPPGSYFVEFDYSQVELRVAAFLAREDTMLHLYATGQDIHMTMAMRMTGKPAHLVTKEERKKAKAVNFGFLYGMGWRKFIMTAWSNYGVKVSEQEAHKYGRVETPMGRVRHLPDIYSPDQGVQAEAERQAINSPVQGFASDMCALSLVLLAKRFREEGRRAYPIGSVHDAVNWEIHGDDLEYCLPIIKDTMENLPLEELFGISVDVPIVADCKVGTRWGAAKEVPEELLTYAENGTVALTKWLNEEVRVTA
jgi:uracil-DNA glycosylase family 4